jgi:hypothetical protein
VDGLPAKIFLKPAIILIILKKSVLQFHENISISAQVKEREEKGRKLRKIIQERKREEKRKEKEGKEMRDERAEKREERRGKRRKV